MSPLRILLLAGTSEARALASQLSAQGHQVVASYAGVTEAPAVLPVPTRHGGFGGKSGQASFMAENGFDLVVDATHPFAARISARTAEICNEMTLPYLRLSRPCWDPDPAAPWHEVDAPSQLADVIPVGVRVFLATGVQSEAIARALPNRTLFCRKVDEGPAPFPLSGGWETGRPPFEVAAEKALFQKLGITWLVAKNAGGPAGGKLKAARDLGLNVVMIARPEGPDAPTVQNVEEAMAWIDSLRAE